MHTNITNQPTIYEGPEGYKLLLVLGIIIIIIVVYILLTTAKRKIYFEIYIKNAFLPFYEKTAVINIKNSSSKPIEFNYPQIRITSIGKQKKFKPSDFSIYPLTLLPGTEHSFKIHLKKISTGFWPVIPKRLKIMVKDTHQGLYKKSKIFI